MVELIYLTYSKKHPGKSGLTSRLKEINSGCSLCSFLNFCNSCFVPGFVPNSYKLSKLETAATQPLLCVNRSKSGPFISSSDNQIYKLAAAVTIKYINFQPGDNQTYNLKHDDTQISQTKPGDTQLSKTKIDSSDFACWNKISKKLRK